ncbi:MAG: serine protease [Gemmataceae bacterium]
MRPLMFAMLLASPWVENKDFPRDVQEKALAATYRLKINGNEASAVCVGKMSGRFYYLTAAHVMGNDDAVDLERFDLGTAKVASKYPVKVVARWEKEDLALLEGGTAAVPCVTICPENKIPSEVPFLGLSVGCTSGQEPQLWLDEVLKAVQLKKTKGQPNFVTHWRLGKQSTPGRSGGPLIDKEGRLIGICSGSDKDNGYYVHISEIRRFLKDTSYGDLLETARK